MSRPAPIRASHKLFALARKSMCQGDIAAKIAVARKNVNRIVLRQVATASQEPGKSAAALRKTTARQECALFRMVHEDRFKSARALIERMRNLYGVSVGRRTINNRLVARGYHARRIPRNPLVTANHHRLRIDWSRQNLTVAAWSHVIWGDEWSFQLYPVDGHMGVRRLPGECFQQDCQAARVQAGGSSVHVWGHSTAMQNHPLCSWTGTSMAWFIGTSCGTPWYHLLGSTLEIIFAHKMTMLCLIILW